MPFFRTSNELTDRLVAEGKDPSHASFQYPDAICGRLKNKLRGLHRGSKNRGLTVEERSFSSESDID